MSFILPRVHNIADAPTGWWESRTATYIGRSEEYARDCGMAAPIWANPYRVPSNGNRAEVIAKYEAWLRRRLDYTPALMGVAALVFAVAGLPMALANRMSYGDALRREILALSGRNLYCHCKPKPCHGDVIVKVFAELAGLS